MKAVPQLRQLVASFPQWRAGSDTRSSHVGFVVDKVTLEQVSSEYLGFLRQFSFHQIPHTPISSGVGAIGQSEADVPSGLNLTPPHEEKTWYKKSYSRKLNSPDKLKQDIQNLIRKS
jgi:hypothetical protein